jgi:membrane associated rhomboid family serine protease
VSDPETPWQQTSTSAPEFWAGEPDFDVEEKPSLDLWAAVGSERPWATVLLVFSWCVVFAAMGIAHTVGDVSAEFRWGGFPSPALAPAEWWRWLAYTAVHGGPGHLASNAFVMLVLGPAVERIFTRAHFLLLFAVGGIAGAAGTLVWGAIKHPDERVVSVGASGAIFALGAALLVGAWRLRRSLAPSRARALAASILWLVVPGLFVGFQMPHVGSAAHVGGFVAGAALGFVLGLDPRLEERAPNAFSRLAGAAAALALAICYTIGFYSGAR